MNSQKIYEILHKKVKLHVLEKFTNIKKTIIFLYMYNESVKNNILHNHFNSSKTKAICPSVYTKRQYKISHAT